MVAASSTLVTGSTSSSAGRLASSCSALGVGICARRIRLLGFRHHRFDLRTGARRPLERSAGTHPSLNTAPHFGQVIVTEVKLRTAMGAQALHTKLWLCHGFAILGYLVESGSPLGVSRRLCQ
jgi:hypothetical protein